MYFLDLFSGIGGFSLGASWAGLQFDGHYFSEVDPYAISVYRKRFPDAIGLGSICDIKGADLPAGEWIIAGGFPCQDISVAGKGAGLAGERSGLWYEYARLIGELRPRFAIMENVGALTRRASGSARASRRSRRAACRPPAWPRGAARPASGTPPRPWPAACACSCRHPAFPRR